MVFHQPQQLDFATQTFVLSFIIVSLFLKKIFLFFFLKM